MAIAVSILMALYAVVLIGIGVAWRSRLNRILGLGLIGLVVASWLIAFMEYSLMVPANRLGYRENGGPFTLVQLKVIQEVITLLIFTVFTLVFFKNESLKWNHLVGFGFLVLAVYFIRK